MLETQSLHLTDRTLFRSQCFAGGSWIDSPAGDTFAVNNPSTGRTLAQVPNMHVETVREAIDAAAQAQKMWAARTCKERSALLRRWYDLIVANVDDLALILTSEQGKPLTEARGEVLANAAYIEWFAEEAKRVYGDVIPPANASQRIVVLKAPVGVCAAITPWNFPNGMIVRKAAPALAAGCTIVVKPAPETPLSAFALAVLAERAGFPAGVFSVMTGPAEPFGREVCTNPKVAKISFTGSTAVGRWLMREAAVTIKRLSLELGGNAPFIVFDDADLDAAVEGAMISKFRNTGQSCVGSNRIYVHERVQADFTRKLLPKVGALVVGDGMEPGVSQGPLINVRSVEKIEDHIADAVAKGAYIALGGKRHARGGTFFEPTVMTGITPEMKVTREETFAPLAPIVTFRDDADAVRMANDSEFGLAAYFYTQNLGRAWRVAEGLESGIVGLNAGLIANEMAPFGGVKQSGLGREGSKYGIEDYLEVKYVCMGIAEPTGGV